MDLFCGKKSVYFPIGGSFTLDYKRTEATYDNPGGKWVIRSVEVNDGSETKTAYSLDGNTNAMVTTVTDAMGNRQASYTTAAS